MSSYSSAFPALHSLQLPLSIQGKRGWASFFPGTSTLVCPKIPTYLQHSRFADLVHEKFDTIQRQQDPMLDWQALDLRLPTSWNSKDKAKHIDVDRLGLQLHYAGPGRSEAHAGSIRTNFAIPKHCGMFYYEVKIISKGDDGFIGIGFCTKENDLNRLPGWDVGSYGFHGDDGHSFAGSGTGDDYGPSFTTHDVIGCGIDFTNQTGFYTKNGTMIGVAFRNIPLYQSYYPVVGLRTPGEAVTTNFGDEPFVFDINQLVKVTDQPGLLTPSPIDLSIIFCSKSNRKSPKR
ncbi:SPRY-domain-containing protein [Hesseltinella vesiculosa]|uniref:SPRY-domain-containing protein n=1 Tax=Hesseltinella vesiculosa TaxID=101127 RepID=A0A1X2G646_9FUNG|nr:SPRY-domain-containing protein [Hesseltinella vesiculosa]